MKSYIAITLIIFFSLFSDISGAQTYYQVTVYSGSQVVNGITVTVTPLNGAGNYGAYCGAAGPYWIGNGSTVNSAFKYVFSSPVTKLRMHMTATGYQEEMSSQINGSAYTYTTANISAFPGTCSCPNVYTVIGGDLINNTSTVANAGATIDINPGFGIDSFLITHLNQNQNGTVYDFYFVNDCPGTVTASATHDTICSGDTLHLFADTTSVSNTATYSWSGPNSFSSTAKNPVISNVSSLAAGSYTVTVTDTGSCTYTSSVNITVNTTPSVTASSNSPLCPGYTLNLSATGISGATYQWTGPNSFSSSSQNPSISTFVIADTGTYHLLTTANGCSTSSIVYVTLNNPGTPVISYNNPVCPGDTLKLNANSASPGVTYSWTGPGSFSATIQNPVIPNAQPVNTGVYSVTVSLNNCSSTASSMVSVNPFLGPPVVSISVSPKDSICAGDNITLSAVASNAGNAPTYQWKRNGTNIGGATSAVFTTGNIANNDLITCKVTSNAPCQPTDTGSSNTIHMYVLSLAPPPVTVTTYPVYYSNGATVTFTGHVPNGSSGLTYQWLKNGAIIPGATNIFYTSSNVKAGDTLCLLVHSSIPCTFPDSTIACVGLTTGVNSISGISSVNIYPNPNKGSFIISGTIFNSNEATIEIMDMLGQVVYKEPVKIENALLEKQITLGKTAAGIYTLLIRTENELKVFKLVINL